ncbi:hypothetical protein NDI37_02730 [Funiculus sociatus GB2-A5]|uniref:Uncharacterized protein n=1 Tax=Funiculus sociatus GB2-A5 TaxID=2933946 RepID=A0ABV0JIZ3_9CYAN|nr:MULTISPECIES: hypothetical protein [unclassified Trichocoleus]MBD1904715.1 hypothetical protein [Trichocoleus sp. FACHB-832]MBD2062513.1 hypothetical protein [Trichocoleus sp. FACHB-6]
MDMFLFLKCHCLGLGTGDWVLGTGDWGLGRILFQFPIPNSQSKETVIFFSPSVLETNLG